MLAWERESDSSLVLCAGIPTSWLAGGGVNVKGLETRWGTVAYVLRPEADHLLLTLDTSNLRTPPGGIEFAPPVPPRGSSAWLGAPAVRVGQELVKLDSGDGRYRWRPRKRDDTPPRSLEWGFRLPANIMSDPR
jgi:hypothetical protein